MTANTSVAERKATPSQLTPPSLLAHNAVLNVGSEGWIFLVLLVAMPKLVSFLGDASFGLFSLSWVVIGYLTFLDIGVNRAATKFISEHLVRGDEAAVRRVVRTAVAANLGLGISGALILVVISPYLVHSLFKVSANLQQQARWTFDAVALALPVLLVQGIFRAVLTSYQRFGWINLVNIAATTAQWTAACWLAWKGHAVAVAVLATVIVRLIATVVYGRMMFRLLPHLRLFRGGSMTGLVHLLRFGGWVSVSQVVSPVLVYLDRMLIASFVSLAAVTLYTVPYELMTRLRVIPSSLALTLYPAFSERGAREQKFHRQQLYERSIRYLLLLLLPGILLLAALGPDVLTLWMGPSFAGKTAGVLGILALGVLVNGISYVPYNMLQAIGRPDLTGKFHLFELPLYILLCLTLIPRWGILGAAAASTARFTLDCGLLFWAASKYGHCSLRQFWVGPFPRILLVGGVFAMGLLTIRLSMHRLPVRLALSAASSLLYIPAAWSLVVERQEKPRIRSAVLVLFRQAVS